MPNVDVQCSIEFYMAIHFVRYGNTLKTIPLQKNFHLALQMGNFPTNLQLITQEFDDAKFIGLWVIRSPNFEPNLPLTAHSSSFSSPFLTAFNSIKHSWFSVQFSDKTPLIAFQVLKLLTYRISLLAKTALIWPITSIDIEKVIWYFAIVVDLFSFCHTQDHF